MTLRIGAVLFSVILAGYSMVQAAENVELKTQKDKLSYAIGVDVGNSLKKNSIDVDMNVLMQGMKDAFSGKPQMTDQQIKETMIAYQKEQAEKNKKAGEAFLAENKKKSGVVTMPSGLQYKIVKKGTGKSPKATDTVTVNYRGTLIDGTEFDSSYKRGQPATFPVNGVIPGWTEALQLMKEGAKWELFIPADLAYGATGRPGIPPNSTLIFEVELISISTPTK